MSKNVELLSPPKRTTTFPQVCLLITPQNQKQSGHCPEHGTQLSTLLRVLKGARQLAEEFYRCPEGEGGLRVLRRLLFVVGHLMQLFAEK